LPGELLVPLGELAELAFRGGAASGFGVGAATEFAVAPALAFALAFALPLPLFPLPLPVALSGGGATGALAVLAAVVCTVVEPTLALSLLGCAGGAASGAAWLLGLLAFELSLPPSATAGTARQTRIASAQSAKLRKVRRLCGGNVPVGTAFGLLPRVTNCRKAPR
jgi:hypothetical protein